MSKYLVTGGAGFIGSKLAHRLIENGNHVTIIDNLSTGFKQNIPKNAIFIEGNCQDSKLYESLDEKFDAIYHIAGQSSGEISFDDPVYDLQTNTQSTLLLLSYAVRTGCSRFIYASSMSIYGDQPDMAISEVQSFKPKSFYGVGKIASEHYLRIYQDFNIQSTALRLFNVYGPGQNMKNLRQGMVSIYLAMAFKNKKIVVKGSKERFRDFVYIDDVINAFVDVEKNSNSFGKVYNIATGVRTNIQTLLDEIESILPFEIVSKVDGTTAGDQHGIFADIKLIKDEIGWEPMINLKDGLKMMIESVFHD